MNIESKLPHSSIQGSRVCAYFLGRKKSQRNGFMHTNNLHNHRKLCWRHSSTPMVHKISQLSTNIHNIHKPIMYIIPIGIILGSPVHSIWYRIRVWITYKMITKEHLLNIKCLNIFSSNFCNQMLHYFFHGPALFP